MFYTRYHTTRNLVAKAVEIRSFSLFAQSKEADQLLNLELGHLQLEIGALMLDLFYFLWPDC